MTCSRCGSDVAANMAFCGSCGAPTGTAAGPDAPLKRPTLVTVLAVLQFIGAAGSVTAGLVLLASAPPDSALGGLLLMALGVLELACGVGLWTLKPYGRAIQLVFSYIGLLGIPIGTIISVLVLIYMYKPGVRVLFSGRPAAELTPEERALAAGVEQGTKTVAIVVALLVVLLVMTIAGIVAAIAIPGLMRAREAGNEISSIASMRAITSAQAAYSASCGSGYYSPSLPNLGVAPPGGVAFLSPDLTGSSSVVKGGYTIALTPGPTVADAPASCNGLPAGSLVESYFVSAEPQSGMGRRYFGMNQEGTIYQSSSPVAVTLQGAPVGATPVR